VLFFFLSIFTDLVVAGVKPENNDIIKGPLADLFFISLTIMVGFIVFFLFKKYAFLLKEDKLKVIFFLIGIVFNATGNLAGNLLPVIFQGTFKYHGVGDFSLIFLLGFTAYAIIKRELFGIKVALTVFFAVIIVIWPVIDLALSIQEGRVVEKLVFKVLFLLIFVILDIFLVRNVIQEIKQKDQLAKLSLELKDLNLHLQEKVDEQTGEIKKAYEVEKKARVGLEDLDKAKTEFILTTQHHLRTPLTVIKGYSDSLLKKPVTDEDYLPKVQDALRKINISSERLMSLINQFLDISQMEAGKSILKLELTSIKPLLKDIIEELKTDIENRHITVSYPQDELSYPDVLIDPNKFKEALIIFVDNAVKYNKENGSITITAKSITHPIEKDVNIYQIIIENTGIGMKPEDMPKLFTHYFERSDEARKLYATGRGLGLTIAKSIVQAHNGIVRAESEGEGKGAKFTIELPIE